MRLRTADPREAFISIALFAEYEALIARRGTQRRCPLTVAEQIRPFEAFLSRTQLVEVYYRWRPNLPDEGHNHVLELAVAAGDAPIVTFNRRDCRGSELRDGHRRRKSKDEPGDQRPL